MQKGLKKCLIILMSMIMVISFAACGGNGSSGGGNEGNTKDPSTVTVPVLPDLTEYGAKTANYTPAKVSYDNATEQVQKLEARRAKEEEESKAPDADNSVIVKIFINSTPADVINTMGKAGLSFDKMVKVVEYLVGDVNKEVALNDHLVVWKDDSTWSFFDDVDYLDKLQERADDEDHVLSDKDKDTAEDNVQRQRRKMMRQIFGLGLAGNEFSMLVIEEIIYAQEVVTTKMYGSRDEEYDEYVKEELSHDTLSYFKAFNEFTKDSKKNACSLYGYYYDYNKAGYNALDDDKFEKELKYGHQNIFTETEWFEYLGIQRDSYVKAYRYSDGCYKKMYTVHFAFETLIESYDLEVYTNPMNNNSRMEVAIDSDDTLTYSKEMLLGVTYGFKEQLIMSDWLYRYSLNETAMKAYNVANTNYENNKNSSEEKKAGPELAYNLERLKIADYILEKMSKEEMTNLLKYQIKVYSADLISAIQTEKKDQVLLYCDLSKISKGTNPIEYEETEIEIGRSEAYVVQLKNNYSVAAIPGQITQANTSDWAGIRLNIQTTLNKDYQKEYDTDVKRRDGFEDTLIKKKYSCGADINDTVCPNNANGHIGCTEEYDTNHALSRFLNSHEDVLRHAIGEVKITPKGKPNKASGSGVYYEIGEGVSAGTYYPGTDTKKGALLKDLRKYPQGFYVTAYSGADTGETVNFEKGLTMTEGLKDAGKPTFLTEEGNKLKITENIEANDGTSNNKFKYTYTFAGWFIDSNLLYEVDMDEEVEFDLVLYPGYIVTKAPVA